MKDEEQVLADAVFNCRGGALAGIKFCLNNSSCMLSFNPYGMSYGWVFTKSDLQEYIDWLCSMRDEHMS